VDEYSGFRLNIGNYAPIVFGSVLASLFTLFALSVNVSAQDAPDYLLGNLTNEKNLTKEQRQEIIDKIANYTSTMKKAANGNQTKLNVLLIEDLAKRNIIDEEAKQDFFSVIVKTNKPPMEGLPGTLPGTIPGNTTDILKDLDASSALLDEIAVNNSDSQVVTLMTDIIKKHVTDIGTVVSGNVTDTGPVTIGDIGDFTYGEFARALTCTLVVASTPGFAGGAANGYMLCKLI